MFESKKKSFIPEPPKPVKLSKAFSEVVPSTDMLATEKRRDLIKVIKGLMDLEAMKFNALGMKLIHHLTDTCQHLPETANSYYALPGGVLDYALNRAEAALELFREFMIAPEGTGPSEIQKLWLYALFSASLLKNIGKLQVDYHIKVFDVFGEPLKTWNPLIESLVAAGSYYQFEFLPDNDEKTLLRQRITLLIARLLMPEEGFAWIASNPEVLAIWLALLSDDWEGAGTLGAILIRADALAIQRYFNENMIHHVGRGGGRAARISTFIDTKPDANLAKEQLTGVAFIKWLMNMLESGQIMLNKAPLFMVPGGLLIHPDAFKLFVRAHPEYKSWQAIQNGFISLNLHQVNAVGDPLSRFEQSKSHQMVEGVLFKDYAIILPKTLKMHNIDTGKTADMSATEAVYLAQFQHVFVKHGKSTMPTALQCLTASGKWQPLASGSMQKPGFMKRG